MSPQRSGTGHELHFLGKFPRLLEQKVNVPFCRMTIEESRNARLKFKPVFYRREFNSDITTNVRAAARKAVTNNATKLDSGDLFFSLWRLREGGSRPDS